MLKFLDLFSLFATLLLLCNANQVEVHKEMNPEEIQETFHTSGGYIPEYETVRLSHTPMEWGQSNYNPPEVQIIGNSRIIKLYLEPQEGYLAGENTPVWTVETNPSSPFGFEYTKVDHAFDTLIGNFHDISNDAAFTVQRDSNGRYLFDGTIGQDMAVRPYPARLRRAAVSHLQNQTNDQIHTHEHIMIKRSPQQGNSFPGGNFLEPINMGSYSMINARAPDVIYPKVLIVVDHSLYRKMGKTVPQIARYMLSLMNGVDLRYRLLINPKIRLHVAGIIIALDDRAVPYLYDNRLKNNLVDANKILDDMHIYFYKENRINEDSYNLVVAFTNLDLCTTKGSDCDRSLAGYATIGRPCGRDQYKKKFWPTGVVEEAGGYAGIISAAHEIGHILGARHDGLHDTTKNCPMTEGYIMSSSISLKSNIMRWSSCSIKAIYETVTRANAKCLQIPPRNMGTRLKIPLPGQTMSLDEQCQRTFGDDFVACFTNKAKICYKLWCTLKGSDSCTAKAPAAEGSPCGTNLICLHGQCVPKP
ncbi:A disintegrin and metalloproteinase with thrombospondin motifs like [Prorops nasuta]|uniref:A disintegrin and metalloproteinase with thrombospondin motifs like n=1 Tax=Prorops nasuta TaxID=863751 RepID=UPI0034CE6A77